MVKKILMVVAPQGFRDEECFEPKSILENKGAVVLIASKKTKVATGMLGATIGVDKQLSEINVNDYNAIIFVGGQGAAKYFDDPDALRIAKEANDKKKIIGAICIAPTILANAGILKGKNATSFHSESMSLRSKGAFFTNENVTVDGNIITAKGPQAAKEFGEAIAKALGYVAAKSIEREKDLEEK